MRSLVFAALFACAVLSVTADEDEDWDDEEGGAVPYGGGFLFYGVRLLYANTAHVRSAGGQKPWLVPRCGYPRPCAAPPSCTRRLSAYANWGAPAGLSWRGVLPGGNTRYRTMKCCIWLTRRPRVASRVPPAGALMPPPRAPYAAPPPPAQDKTSKSIQL